MKVTSKKLFGFSPWLVVGMALILGIAITVLAIRNTQREKGYMTQNLLDRAEALIWALEAGSRTGMGMRSGENRLLQPLVEETAKQPGIIFMAVTDTKGTILAHSDQKKVGSRLEPDLLPRSATARPAWRLRERDGGSIFEVYRLFSPFGEAHHSPNTARDCCDFHAVNSLNQGARHGWSRWGGMRGGRWGQGQQTTPTVPKTDNRIVFVGLDQEPFIEALAEDYRNSFLSAALVAAIALAGFVSLFWAHSYRNSRRQLKDTKALASEVVSNLPLGLLTSDPNGKVGVVNEVALTMLGLNRHEVIGTRLRDVQGLDWDSLTKSLILSGKVVEMDTVLMLPGERQLPISLSAAEMRNEDGLFLGHLFIMRDTAEMKRLQAQVRRNDRLTALGNLAAGVAHEIRNPLSTIKVLATYLAKTLAPGGNEEETAKSMIEEIDRLNRVVSELLDFARPGAVALSTTDLNEVVARALRLAEADLKSKNIQVRFNENPALCAVPMNQERFIQALLNLLLNAVQSMERNGKLTITAKVGVDDTYSLEIADTGEGMSEEVQAHIFTPYYTTKSSGTGLGLAIVHQIIEGHGGSVSVKSSPGSGSVFTITLPFQEHSKE